MKKLYMAVTRDELSLPLAVAEKPEELAKMRKVTKGHVMSEIAKRNRRKYPGYVKVEVDEDESN